MTKIKIRESVLRNMLGEAIKKQLNEGNYDDHRSYGENESPFPEDREFDSGSYYETGMEVDDFTPHGSYTVSNSGGYEVMLSDDGDMAKVRDAFGSDNPETSDWLPIEYVEVGDELDAEGFPETEPVIDPNGYNIPLNQVMRMNESKKINVSKSKLTEIVKRVIKESTDRDRYENVVFLQGEEADEALDILNNEGRDAALDYLAQWHDVGNHMGSDSLGHGASDNTYERDGYIMSWNSSIGYIGLTYDLSHMDEGQVYGESKQTNKKVVKEGVAKNNPKIERAVAKINELIAQAVDSNGDPIGVVDPTSTWEEPFTYEPIIYRNGALKITSCSPHSNRGQKNVDIIRSSDMEMDGIPTLQLISRMYKKAIKNKDNNLNNELEY